MEFGEVDLEKDDLIVFYTDGFENLVRAKDFFLALNQEDEAAAKKKFLDLDEIYSKDNANFGRERTLVAIEI